jgi:hypothetical protein
MTGERRTIVRRAQSQLRTVFGRFLLVVVGYDMPYAALKVPGGVGWKLGSSGGRYHGPCFGA